MTEKGKIVKERRKNANLKGLFHDPLFYFGFGAFFLLASICFNAHDFSSLNILKRSDAVFFNSFFNNSENLNKDALFVGTGQTLALETPDLKLVQDNCVCGVTTTNILSTRVLGDLFGSGSASRNEISEYIVQPGDTLQSIAQSFNISLNTLLWANELSSGSKVKVGQTLVVLPVSGVVRVVRSGDTITQIAKTYKASADDIVAFNGLSNEGDIYIGDILIVPGGTMPSKSTPIGPSQTPLADNFFIIPAEGQITQGVHWYNAVDLANKCGTPIHAAAAGTVQRVKYGWNFGGGNSVTILHANGVVTYYGHLQTIFVNPGDVIDTGDRIALMGGQPGMAGAGISTGCHVHFETIGAKNPLSKYGLGTKLKY